MDAIQMNKIFVLVVVVSMTLTCHESSFAHVDGEYFKGIHLKGTPQQALVPQRHDVGSPEVLPMVPKPIHTIRIKLIREHPEGKERVLEEKSKDYAKRRGMIISIILLVFTVTIGSILILLTHIGPSLWRR